LAEMILILVLSSLGVSGNDDIM